MNNILLNNHYFIISRFLLCICYTLYGNDVENISRKEIRKIDKIITEVHPFNTINLMNNLQDNGINPQCFFHDEDSFLNSDLYQNFKEICSLNEMLSIVMLYLTFDKTIGRVNISKIISRSMDYNNQEHIQLLNDYAAFMDIGLLNFQKIYALFSSKQDVKGTEILYDFLDSLYEKNCSIEKFFNLSQLPKLNRISGISSYNPFENKLPSNRCKGIYLFTFNKSIVYVGSAFNINRRVNRHINSGFFTENYNLISFVYGDEHNQDVILEDEKSLIRFFEPSENKIIGSPGRKWQNDIIAKISSLDKKSLFKEEASPIINRILRGKVVLYKDRSIADALKRSMRLFR